MLENHWTILGAGSIGSLFACLFQQAGIDSTLLIRPDKAHQSNTNNLTLTSLDHSNQVFFLNTLATDKIQAPITQLLLTTKAHQSESAIACIHSRIAKGATIVILQNGMGVVEQLHNQLPHCNIIVASTTEGANQPTTHSLVHAGTGTTWIGPPQPHPLLISLARDICQQWQTLAVDVQYDHDIKHRLWKKLAINCAINPLTVKYQCTNGKLLDNREALLLMQGVCDEIQQIMTALSIPHQNNLFELVKQIAKDTQQNRSSMLQDHQHQRPTEIDYINGYVVDAGKKLAIPTPINNTLMDVVNHPGKNNA